MAKLNWTSAIQYIRSASFLGRDLENLLEALVKREDMGIKTALTASGAVVPGASLIELNHATVVIAATIAKSTNHVGLLNIVNTSASGTAAHTVTLASGTWNGTNTVATFNAPGKILQVFFDQDGNGRVITNTGTVTFS